MKRKAVMLLVCWMLFINGYVYAKPDDTYYEKAITKLSEMGILEEGTDDYITRAEAVIAVLRFLGYRNMVEKTDQLIAGQRFFRDVQGDEALLKYFSLARSLWLVDGYGDGYFGPDDYVTYEQMIKMIGTAMSYQLLSVRYGGYPQGFIKAAEDFGFSDGIDFQPKAYATRKDITIMLYQALSCFMVVQPSGPPDEDGFPRYSIMNGIVDPRTSNTDGRLETAQMRYYRIMNLTNNSTFFVLDAQNRMILNNNDVSYAYIDAVNDEQNEFDMEITLTVDAQGKLSSATRKMAQLPQDNRFIKILFDDLVISQMEVTDAMEGSSLRITGSFRRNGDFQTSGIDRWCSEIND